MSLDNLSQEVLSKIDPGETVALLKDLIRIPSHRNAPGGESKVAERIAYRLEKAGIHVELREVTEGRSNVVACIRGSGEGYSLMLNGHMDTVPEYGWKTAAGPFSAEMRAGRIYGRGTVDMKGGLAAMVSAMEAIQKSEVALEGDLVFTGVVGEEGSCSIGAEEIIRNGPLTDFAIVGEATNLDVGIVNRGSSDFEITTYGRTAHTGEPEQGINAIVNMAHLIGALEDEFAPQLESRKHRLLGSSVMNISKIEGGIYGDVVPDLCKLWVRIRYVPYYNPEKLRKMINKILQKTGDEHHFEGDVRTQVKSHPWKWGNVVAKPYPGEVSQDSLIVEVLTRNVKRVTGMYPKIIGCKGWADSALFINEAGIPTPWFGPGNGGAHSPVECVEVSQLHKSADIFALTALDVCSRKKRKSK